MGGYVIVMGGYVIVMGVYNFLLGCIASDISLLINKKQKKTLD